MKRDSFHDYVVDQLRGVPDVEARAMFGGHGLYRGGDFFGILFKGRFYLKTDERSRAAYVEAGMKPFRPSARQRLASYYEVPADVLEDAEELAEWAGKALAAASKRRR